MGGLTGISRHETRANRDENEPFVFELHGVLGIYNVRASFRDTVGAGVKHVGFEDEIRVGYASREGDNLLLVPSTKKRDKRVDRMDDSDDVDLELRRKKVIDPVQFQKETVRPTPSLRSFTRSSSRPSSDLKSPSLSNLPTKRPGYSQLIETLESVRAVLKPRSIVDENVQLAPGDGAHFLGGPLQQNNSHPK